MITLLYISISVFALYVLFIVATKGVTKSISDSVYVIGEDNLFSSLFTWFCFLVSISLLPYWIDHNTADQNIIPFISCSALMFVGASPHFKTHQKMVHFSSAIVCFLSAYIWIFLYGNHTVFLVSLAGLVIASFFKNRLFWWEIIAFVTIYISLL